MTTVDEVAPPTIKKPDTLILFVREKFALSNDWHGYHFSTSEKEVPDGYMLIKGVEAPLKKNGRPDFKRRIKSTDRTVFVHIEEWKRWEQAKADAAGVCVECWGSKAVWFRWSKTTGSHYRQCPKCK